MPFEGHHAMIPLGRSCLVLAHEWAVLGTMRGASYDRFPKGQISIRFSWASGKGTIRLLAPSKRGPVLRHGVVDTWQVNGVDGVDGSTVSRSTDPGLPSWDVMHEVGCGPALTHNSCD
jgi:hypothetical protein